MPDHLLKYEDEVIEYAHALYEGGHTEEEALAIAWGTVQFLYALGLI